MTSALRKESKTATVIPFPKSKDGTSGQDPFMRSLINELSEDPQFEDKIKALVEGYVAELWVKSLNENTPIVDDPFDPIYLANLRPDNIDQATINSLDLLKDIKDLSDEVFFDDGWDE